jgi:quercetin dioxygenase-like cupin family protein
MFKPVRVPKPWGHELIWAHTDRYVGKVLHIDAGQKLSLQFHNFKDETIHMLSGRMNFEVEENGVMVVRTLLPGDSYHIPPKAKHRMEAEETCEVLEASTPHLDDVVRLQDAYGRVAAEIKNGRK